jgi:transcriptional regulator with XRE-family HTH domain
MSNKFFLGGNMTGDEIRRARAEARISGSALCAKARIDRGRLSNIERGYVIPSVAELARIEVALAALMEARRALAEFAAKLEFPGGSI